MNYLKSIFISLYITLLTLASLKIAIELFMGNPIEFVWYALALCIWPNLLFFVKLFVFPAARTSKNLPILSLTSSVGCVLAVMNMHAQDWVNVISIGVILGIGGHASYTFWYSSLGRLPSRNITLGHPLPKFSLTDIEGIAWSSTQISQYSIFLFFRGNWCPLCMAQIKEISREYQTLASQDVQVYLVSPQPFEHMQKLAQSYDVAFNFMQDTNNQVASLLEIAAVNGTPKGMEILGYDTDTVLPTVIITNENGLVIYHEQTDNYRVRPEPSTFIEVIDSHKNNLIDTAEAVK